MTAMESKALRPKSAEARDFANVGFLEYGRELKQLSCSPRSASVALEYLVPRTERFARRAGSESLYGCRAQYDVLCSTHFERRAFLPRATYATHR